MKIKNCLITIIMLIIFAVTSYIIAFLFFLSQDENTNTFPSYMTEVYVPKKKSQYPYYWTFKNIDDYLSKNEIKTIKYRYWAGNSFYSFDTSLDNKEKIYEIELTKEQIEFVLNQLESLIDSENTIELSNSEDCYGEFELIFNDEINLQIGKEYLGTYFIDDISEIVYKNNEELYSFLQELKPSQIDIEGAEPIIITVDDEIYEIKSKSKIQEIKKNFNYIKRYDIKESQLPDEYWSIVKFGKKLTVYLADDESYMAYIVYYNDKEEIEEVFAASINSSFASTIEDCTPTRKIEILDDSDIEIESGEEEYDEIVKETKKWFSTLPTVSSNINKRNIEKLVNSDTFIKMPDVVAEKLQFENEQQKYDYEILLLDTDDEKAYSFTNRYYFIGTYHGSDYLVIKLDNSKIRQLILNQTDEDLDE